MKTAHQMWHSHSFSQRNRTTEKTVVAGIAGDREVVGVGVRVDKIWKKGGGRQYRWGLHKVGGLVPLCQLCEEPLKIFHPPL